ncbi:MAG: type II toxin-antitoxin system HicA family toxin [Candidatus Acidiferrales bacterium]
MTRLPRIKGKEVVSALQKAGFHVDRVRGSHIFLKHPDGRATVVPMHSCETIGIGLNGGDPSRCGNECGRILKIPN